MKTKSVVFIMAAMACMLAAGQVLATEVIADGQAAIVNNDKAMARDKALEDALRKAVEQAVGTMVTSETVTKDFQLLEDNIYSNSKGFVQKYEIVNEKVEDNVYIAKIKADVATGAIEGKLKAIGVLLSRKGKPRVMFLISEQNVGQESANSFISSDIGVTENTLVDEFQKNGFTIVDRQALSGKIKVEDAMKVVNENDSSTAKKIANLAGAQVVIYGKAIAKDAGLIKDQNNKETKMHSGQANISARALNADSGEIICTDSVHKAFPHIDAMTAGMTALRLSAEDLGNRMIEKIMAKWSQDLSGGQMIAIEVGGVPDIKIVNDLKNLLTQQVRGIQGVQIRRLAKPDSTLDVDYKGKGQDLALDLSEKKLGRYRLEILEATPNTIKIKIISEGGEKK